MRPPLQGTHTAMKSGMLAAEAAFNAITSQPAGRPLDLSAYESSLRNSWVGGWREGALLLCCTQARPNAVWAVGRWGARAPESGQVRLEGDAA